MTLVAMLDRESAVFTACRDAVLHGATFRIHPGAVDRLSLLHIYRRRERLTRRRGRCSLGFAEAVDDLSACELDQVLIGYVRCTAPLYHFQLFVSPDETRIVACLGVELPPAGTTGTPPQLG
jgi:hypothetical protein